MSGSFFRKRAVGGGGWTPDDEASLVRWIKSDALGGSLNNDDPITTAADASGLGNSLTAAGTERPTFKTNVKNGLPAMLFVNASSTRLAGSVVSGTAKTWAFVYRASADSNAVASTTDGVGNYTNFAGAGYFAEFRTARIDNYPATMPTSGDVVIIGTSSSSAYEVFVDNVSAGSQSAAFTAGDFLRLGRNGLGNVYFNNYIFEYVEFNEAFNSTQRNNLFSYLSTRWQ